MSVRILPYALRSEFFLLMSSVHVSRTDKLNVLYLVEDGQKNKLFRENHLYNNSY
jgi:hypothetical protein